MIMIPGIIIVPPITVIGTVMVRITPAGIIGIIERRIVGITPTEIESPAVIGTVIKPCARPVIPRIKVTVAEIGPVETVDTRSIGIVVIIVCDVRISLPVRTLRRLNVSILLSVLR
jgi:hypothetical protein